MKTVILKLSLDAKILHGYICTVCGIIERGERTVNVNFGNVSADTILELVKHVKASPNNMPIGWDNSSAAGFRCQSCREKENEKA